MGCCPQEPRREVWHRAPRRGAPPGLFDAIHAGGGVVDELPAVGLGQLAKGIFDKLLRTRPDGGRVRIVRRPHGVVCRITVVKRQMPVEAGMIVENQ